MGWLRSGANDRIRFWWHALARAPVVIAAAWLGALGTADTIRSHFPPAEVLVDAAFAARPWVVPLLWKIGWAGFALAVMEGIFQAARRLAKESVARAQASPAEDVEERMALIEEGRRLASILDPDRIGRDPATVEAAEDRWARKMRAHLARSESRNVAVAMDTEAAQSLGLAWQKRPGMPDEERVNFARLRTSARIRYVTGLVRLSRLVELQPPR